MATTEGFDSIVTRKSFQGGDRLMLRWVVLLVVHKTFAWLLLVNCFSLVFMHARFHVLCTGRRIKTLKA